MSKVTKPSSASPKEAETERSALAPEVDIYETKDEFVLQAEMAGVNKDGLEISLDGNVLTFLGRRQDEAPAPRVLYRESQEADYRRTFELDPSIETSKITARMNQGVLTLTLPKVERAKPRRITVA